MPEHEYYVVDASTAEPFQGNPAGVVLDAAGLSDRQMRNIAREINVSETTFILPPTSREAAVRFRWFTPTQEVSMCGHATLAGMKALLDAGRYHALLDEPGSLLPIETKGGLLKIRLERLHQTSGQPLFWLEMIEPTLTAVQPEPALWGKLLGVDRAMFDTALPPMRTQDGDLLVSVQSFQALWAACPDRVALAEYCSGKKIRGFCLATVDTPDRNVDVQSRFFAPVVGIDEDPVTGSVHGPLGVYLVAGGLISMRDNVAALRCVQAVPGERAGFLHVLVSRRPGSPYSVRVGGQCAVTLRGKIVA